MKLAFVVIAHRDPEHVARLLRALEHPRVRRYLHVDAKAPLEPFTRALDEAGVTDVTLLPRHACIRGDIGLVDAGLEGLRSAVADDCGYFLLLSGQDFPLLPPSELVAFADSAGTRSYVNHWPISASVHQFNGRDRTEFYAYTVRGQRELCIPRGEDTGFLSVKGRLLNDALRARSMLKGRRRFPSYAEPYAGHMWWNLSRPAADYVLRFLADHPDYYRYHLHTIAPEELFVQSILAGTDFASEHELVDDALRYREWEGTHARVLTEADLPAMLASGQLFALKFDPGVDAHVVERLAEHIAA
jgi:hypothetical protein